MRHGDPVHHARPEPGAPLLASRRRDGARPARRAGRDRRRVRAPAAPVHDASCIDSRPQRVVQPVRGRRAGAGCRRATSTSTFASAQRLVRASDAFHAVRNATLRAAARRDARHRRRIGFGQDDARHGAARAAADRERRDHARRRRASTTPTARRCARCAGACRWCSRTRSRRCSPRMTIEQIVGEGVGAAHAGARPSERDAQAHRRHARRGRPVGGATASADVLDALSARILGRPAPAHRDRARGRAAAGGAGARRADVGARRVGAAAGAEAARRAAGAATA